MKPNQKKNTSLIPFVQLWVFFKTCLEQIDRQPAGYVRFSSDCVKQNVVWINGQLPNFVTTKRDSIIPQIQHAYWFNSRNFTLDIIMYCVKVAWIYEDDE